MTFLFNSVHSKLPSTAWSGLGEKESILTMCFHFKADVFYEWATYQNRGIGSSIAIHIWTRKVFNNLLPWFNSLHNKEAGFSTDKRRKSNTLRRPTISSFCECVKQPETPAEELLQTANYNYSPLIFTGHFRTIGDYYLLTKKQEFFVRVVFLHKYIQNNLRDMFDINVLISHFIW